TKTPYVAVFASGGLAIAFCFIGDLEKIAELTNFIIFLVFAMINITLIAARYHKHKKECFHEPSIGKFPVLALFGLAITLFMITFFLMLMITGGYQSDIYHRKNK
ncbi:MAG: amino acid transporter, partial [Nanoarchaeota archaeon]|nr:amino acid transporter [Nanoarchaeota archaeon]